MSYSSLRIGTRACYIGSGRKEFGRVIKTTHSHFTVKFDRPWTNELRAGDDGIRDIYEFSSHGNVVFSTDFCIDDKVKVIKLNKEGFVYAFDRNKIMIDIEHQVLDCYPEELKLISRKYLV